VQHTWWWWLPCLRQCVFKLSSETPLRPHEATLDSFGNSMEGVAQRVLPLSCANVSLSREWLDNEILEPYDFLH